MRSNRCASVQQVRALHATQLAYREALNYVSRYAVAHSKMSHPVGLQEGPLAKVAKDSSPRSIHSHVLQDVLARLEKTFRAFFRRVRWGEKAGFPRFKPATRCHSFAFKEIGNGARLDNGALVLSKIGRINVHWSRPLEGTPKTATISREADGWYVAISCADAPVHALPSTGQDTGIDLGLESFATLANG